jgi:hypothetical protein
MDPTRSSNTEDAETVGRKLAEAEAAIHEARELLLPFAVAKDATRRPRRNRFDSILSSATGVSIFCVAVAGMVTPLTPLADHTTPTETIAALVGAGLGALLATRTLRRQ